jgi:hypothetical protein
MMDRVKLKDAYNIEERYWSEVVGVGVANRGVISKKNIASEVARSKEARAADAAIHGTPSPKPNFTYKMKIVLGFLQILTSLIMIVQAPLPRGFKAFVGWFSLVNFDFFQVSGTECVVNSNYYTKYLVVSLAPVSIFLLVSIFYLFPKYLGKAFHDEDSAARKRSRKKFWRMLLFSLFLIYPIVSSTVLRIFICKEIEGEHYLLADFRLKCYTPEWYSYASSGTIFVLMYPIGIPFFFGYMIRRYQFRLKENEVKAELGFLYDAYDHDVW